MPLGAAGPLVGVTLGTAVRTVLRRPGWTAGAARRTAVALRSRLVVPFGLPHLGPDLTTRRLDPGGYGRVGRARTRYAAVAALPLLDGGDQFALAHPSGAGDTERRGH